jgi:hypothetical protein
MLQASKCAFTIIAQAVWAGPTTLNNTPFDGHGTLD